MLRIAAVEYLNTLPLIEGLEKLAGVELVRAVPSRIANLLASGGADVGLASVIDAAVAPDRFTLLSAGMIGCDGPTLTVRLFSAVPVGRIETVHADTDSHTSVALCRILLDRLHGIRPEVIGLDARETQYPKGDTASLLLIGDKVVTHAPPAARFPHMLDLGAAWHELTGLPFVYAAWMCRAGEEDSPAVRTLAAVLDRQRRHNAMRLDWIVSRRAAGHGWPEDLARHYIGSCLRYDAGERERESVERFCAEAARLGLIGGAPALRWAGGAPAAAAH